MYTYLQTSTNLGSHPFGIIPENISGGQCVNVPELSSPAALSMQDFLLQVKPRSPIWWMMMEFYEVGQTFRPIINVSLLLLGRRVHNRVIFPWVPGKTRIDPGRKSSVNRTRLDILTREYVNFESSTCHTD